MPQGERPGCGRGAHDTVPRNVESAEECRCRRNVITVSPKRSSSPSASELDAPDQALGPLRTGLGLAQACGAHALVERGRAALDAAGAQPLREVLGSGDSLTPGQRRVADLAVQGWSEREIAEALFITAKTVEDELEGVYAKLGLRGLDDLVASRQRR